MTVVDQKLATPRDSEIDAFRDALFDDIRSNRIILPSLPDVALRIRDVIGNPKSDAGAIARIINADPAIAARIMKVANSALYQRQHNVVTDLRGAIARLGSKLVHTLVTNLAIVQVMHSPSAALKAPLEKLFKHCTEVAAMSYALAKRNGKINPETAMLGGMVHDIGQLPILQKAGNDRTLRNDPARQMRLLSELHPEIGAFVLENWGFSNELIAGARDHENQLRDHAGPADLVDVLIVADLQLRHHDKRVTRALDLSRVSAFTRLEIDPAADLVHDPAVSAHYTETLTFLTQ